MLKKHLLCRVWCNPWIQGFTEKGGLEHIPFRWEGNTVYMFDSCLICYSYLATFIILSDCCLRYAIWYPSLRCRSLLQDNTAIPHLNGSCGSISVWHYLHLNEGSTLYTRATPWPFSIFASNTYRWTLPSWTRRAKVMLSLVELAEELYEKDGVRLEFFCFGLFHMKFINIHVKSHGIW